MDKRDLVRWSESAYVNVPRVKRGPSQIDADGNYIEKDELEQAQSKQKNIFETDYDVKV